MKEPPLEVAIAETRPPWPRLSNPLGANGLLVLVYVCGALFVRHGLNMNTLAADIQLGFPSLGLGLAALMGYGWQLWPGMVLGNLAAALLFQASSVAAFSIAIGHSLAVLGCVWLFAGPCRTSGNLGRVHDLACYLIVGAVGALFTALVGALTVYTLGFSHYDMSFLWFAWWAANTLSLILLGVPLLFCSIPGTSLIPPERQERQQFLAFTLVAVFLLAALFLGILPKLLVPLRPYIFFPLVIWGAFALPRSIAVICTALLALAILVGSAQLSAPLDPTALTQLWLFTFLLVLTGIGASQLLEERRRIIVALTRSEAQAARSEANFRSISQCSAMLIRVSDPVGQCTWLNDTWRNFTGRGDEDLGRGWQSLIHDDDRNEAITEIVGAMAMRDSFRVKYRLRHRDGDYRLIEDSGGPRVDAGGRFLGYISTCRDITEERALAEELEQRERLVRTLYDSSSVGICVVDHRQRIAHANQRMADMFGYSLEELTGMIYSDLVHPSERPQGANSLHRLLFQEAEVVERERHYVHKDGHDVWGHVMGRPLLDAAGTVMGVVTTIADVTGKHRADQYQRLTAKVFETSNEGILITDAQNRILQVNQAFTRITGYEPSEVLGKSPSMLSSGRQSVPFYAQMWHYLLTDGRWAGEITNRRKNGEIYSEWLSITTVRNEEGALINFVAVFSDVTQHKRDEARIRHLAQYDYLTDLPNRALLYDRIKQIHAGAVRYQRQYGIIFVDLDNFKPINDEYGHDVGDSLLRQVSQRLRDNVRAADTVARHGGDEFVILVPELQTSEEACALADKLLAIVGQPYLIGDRLLSITPSIGIALYPDHGAEPEQLVRAADQAMYQAKHQGRNKVVIAREDGRPCN